MAWPAASRVRSGSRRGAGVIISGRGSLWLHDPRLPRPWMRRRGRFFARRSPGCPGAGAGMLFAKLKMTAAMALGVMLWAASAAACMRSGDDPGAGPQDQGVAVNAREQAHRDSTDDARGKAPVNPDKQAKQAKEED